MLHPLNSKISLLNGLSNLFEEMNLVQGRDRPVYKSQASKLSICLFVKKGNAYNGIC